MESVNICEEHSRISEELVDQDKPKSTQKSFDVTSTKKQLGCCGVCGEDADGFFFGALVCLPCKSFYVRTLNEDPGTMRCAKNTNNCVIAGTTRSSCKYCRFNKCLQMGMVRKIRPEVVEASANQELCAVCQDISNGVHFGALTCEGCKKFFRRSLKESSRYVCRFNKDCIINPRTRNDCRYCRFQKCLSKGMSKDVKIGRPRKDLVLTLTNQSHSTRQIEMLQNNPAVKVTDNIHSTDVKSEDSLSMHKHDPKPQSHLLDGTPQILQERNQLGLDPSESVTHTAKSVDQLFDDYTEQQRDSAVEHFSTLDYKETYRDSGYLPTDTLIEGFEQETFMSRAITEQDTHSDQISFVNNTGEHGIFTVMPDLPDLKPKQPYPQFNTVDFSAMKDTETSGMYQPRSTGHSGDLKVAKHKLAEKEHECSCHKLRRLAIEKMDVPLPMKTMLIQKIESEKMNAKSLTPDPRMTGMLGMMNMMSKMSDINSKSQGQDSEWHKQSLPVKMEVTGPFGGHGDVPQLGSNPMNMLSMLEKFKNIKCPFCSNGTGMGDHLQVQSEEISSAEDFSVSRSDPEESDAACLVHCQENISAPMSFSHIPPSSSNCICLKNLQRQHSKEGQSLADSLTYADNPGILSQIHIRPGTPKGNVSQFTTMLESMMDQREDLVSSHRHIHPTPQACTETIDKLRMLLKVFGIQEIQPKPNVNFEKHVFPPDYWLQPKLPGEGIMLDMKNKMLLETVGSAYNHLIMIMHEKVGGPRPQPSHPDQFPMEIVRKRTIRNLSHWITFIKAIPDFVRVAPGDQFTIVRLAGMMGIMLATALHQYDPDEHNFTNFYNFEFHPEHPHYHFRHALLKFGCDIQELSCDFIESAMMNACMAIATDFPDLESTPILEKIRQNLLEAFRSYTTAKYGTPNGRVEEIFAWIPRLRELGLWNYKLSFSTCFSFEEKASVKNS